MQAYIPWHKSKSLAFIGTTIISSKPSMTTGPSPVMCYNFSCHFTIIECETFIHAPYLAPERKLPVSNTKDFRSKNTEGKRA
jgi:hypothetical protein